MRLKVKLGVALVLVSALAGAHDYAVKALTITNPWTRATPPGADTGGVYLVIKNKGDQAETLVSASSAVAGKVTFHSMSMSGNVMKMRAVDVLVIPAHGELQLAPSGFHLMLEGLKQPLKLKDEILVNLHFKDAGDVAVKAVVAPLGSSGGDDAMGGMKM